MTDEEYHLKWDKWLVEHGFDPDKQKGPFICFCMQTGSCPIHVNPENWCFGVIPENTVCMHGNTHLVKND